MAQDDGRARAGRMLHTIHAARDDGPLRRAYLMAFGGMAFAESYHAGEDRDMALIYVADHMVEPMAPRRPDAIDMRFARYVAKYGPGWHSISVQVDDAAQASARVRAKGAQLTTDYPGFFFVHPRTTGGIIFEVTDYRMTNDPKDEPSWNPHWAAARQHQPRRLARIVCAVRDLSPTIAFFTQAFDGTLLEQGHCIFPQPARFARIHLGDGELLILQPDSQDAGPLADFLSVPCSGVYALAWEVGSLDAACAGMADNGLTVNRHPDMAEVMLEGARHWLAEA